MIFRAVWQLCRAFFRKLFWLKQKQTHHFLAHDALRRHLVIYGQSGSGKSWLIEWLLMQLVLAGSGNNQQKKSQNRWGWCVVDIHGDLYENMCYRLAGLAAKYPHLKIHERLVVIDPLRLDISLSLNPLEALPGVSPEMSGRFMTDVLLNIWGIEPSAAPRMTWITEYSFIALSDLGLTLPDVGRWLTDKDWRESLLPKLTNPEVRAFWEHKVPKKDQDIQEWVTPALNKLEPLYLDKRLKYCLSGYSALTAREILDKQILFLVNIPKGRLGQLGASMMGGLLVELMKQAAFSRADSHSGDGPPYLLALDEFQHYANRSIEDVLTGARKYGLAILCASQFFSQIKNVLVRDAVLNTAGTIFSFRVDIEDSRRLTPKIFPYPEFPLPNGDEPLAPGWEGLALEIANLPDRTFWMRRRGPYEPVRQITKDMPEPVISPQIEAHLEKILAYSAQKWGLKERSNETQKHYDGDQSTVKDEDQSVTPEDYNGYVDVPATGAEMGDEIWDEY